MHTPQFRIQQLNELLNDDNIDFLRDDLAFAVARTIVEYGDRDLLRTFPPWVTERIEEMCASYRQHGQYIVLSNLGETDHSAMVAELGRLLHASD